MEMQVFESSILGSDMIFYALTAAGSRGRCLNLNLKGKGFNTADINVLENDVWSLLLHNNILSLENFRENASKSFVFLYQ